MIELKSICFEDVQVDENGYWIKFARSKQRSKLEQSEVLIPRRKPDWIKCAVDSTRKPIDYDPASVIDAYLEAVMEDLKCSLEDLKGPFFKGTHGKNGRTFIRSNIGKNTLALVGIEAATELGLRHPKTFTGHCWRRSAGTNASDAGANVTSLMTMMGWSCPKTAIQYVSRSRITSLQMSLYLTNVQRSDKVDPFPPSNVRSRRALKFRNETTSVEKSSEDSEAKSVPEISAGESAEKTDVQHGVTTKPGVSRVMETCSSKPEVMRVDGGVQESSIENSAVAYFESLSRCDVDSASVCGSATKSDVNCAPIFRSRVRTDVKDERRFYKDSVSGEKNEDQMVGSKGVHDDRAEQILHSFSVPVVYASDLSGACIGGASGCVSNTELQSSESFNLNSIDPRLVNVLSSLQNNGTVNINVNFNK
jgi:hypothetical protein